MKYFILFGTLFFCTSLTAEPEEETYSRVELVRAYKSGYDAGVNKKIIGCTLRSM